MERMCVFIVVVGHRFHTRLAAACGAHLGPAGSPLAVRMPRLTLGGMQSFGSQTGPLVYLCLVKAWSG